LILVVISYTLTLLLSVLFGIIQPLNIIPIFDHTVTTLSFIGISMRPSGWG